MRGALRQAGVQRRVGLWVVAGGLVALGFALVARGENGIDATSMWLSAVSAVVAVCAFASDLLREPAEPPAGRDTRRQAADGLAEAVDIQWANEARLRRLQDPAPLDVGLRRVGPPLADHRRNIDRGRPLPAPRDADQRLERIVEIFGSLPAGRLVVLGEPGAGKTILAVQFVRGVLAARRPGGPVPVLFTLASWDPRSTSLQSWLAERLAVEYRPLAAVRGERTLARELVDEGLVLPVLDGFDELPASVRRDALRRLNAGLDERLPVLLTCRTADWARAMDGGDVLTAAEVVRLRPLDPAGAGAYLESTARADHRGATVWTPVLAAPSAPLAEVLASPLMVALARTVYGDTSRDPAELADTERFPTAGSIERHLLDAFVPAAFADAEGTEGVWRPEAAHRWLRCLARERALHGTGAGGTWQLAWWELPAAMPRALRVIGPALLALIATASALVPLAVYGGGVVGNWDSPLSALFNFAGDLAGLAFGLALLLPATSASRQGPRQLARMALTLTAAALVVAVALGRFAPPLISFRLGGAITPRASWFLNGCCFGLLLAMMFAVAGLPRRPLPLGLPWAGSPTGPRAVRALGGLMVFTGLAIYGYWAEAVPALTCLVAGSLLCLAGQRRGERVMGQYTGPAAVVRGFGRGLLRGFAACLLIGVSASAAVGGVTGAFAAYEIHSAPDRRDGEVLDAWRLNRTDGGGRSVSSTGPRELLLVRRAGLERPFAVPKGAPMSWDGAVDAYEGRVELRQRGGQWVLDWRGDDPGWRGRPVDAHNVVSMLPDPVLRWVVHRPVAGVVKDAMLPLLGFGVLLGTIGGCASGVYRALNIPSDTIRATSPQSTLRTDRAATLARSAIAAVLAGGVCLVLISALRRGSTLGTMHTELWVPVGTSALALSAWGRLGAARIWLALTGRAPWRLMRFLEEAHRRGVLRQSGARYEFRHLRLQQRLAAGPGAPPAAPDRAGAPADGAARGADVV
ncbi:NACHT domain-containing protein [Streptomyces sp. NPDC001889]